MSTRSALAYPVLMAVLGTAVLTTSGPAAAPRAALWAAIGAVTAVAILYGVWQHAPYHRAPWWLLTGAVTAIAAGNSLIALGDGASALAGTLAPVCHLCALPLATAGLLLLARSSTALHDRSRTLDLLAFACAAALAFWAIVLRPSLAAAPLAGATRFVPAAYALGTLLVLVSTVRLAVTARFTPSLAVLVAGGSALVVAGLSHTASLLPGDWRPGAPAELGYLLFCAACTAAAVHRSMAALTGTVVARPSRLPAHRAVLLALSLAVPPALLLAGAGIRDAAGIGTVWLIMLLLILARLTDAIGHYRSSLIRERALREACGVIVSAPDAERIGEAARAAVAALLPAGHPYRTALTGPGASPVPRMPAGRRSRLIDAGLLHPATTEALDRQAPHGPAPHGPAPARLAAGGYEAALVCPLGLDGRPSSSGALVVAASSVDLLTARNAIEVLAAQAALALDRISLLEAMNRQDGDDFLRAVVRNTSDIVLVVEPSGQIRYASPSLATIAGVDLAALPGLPDLIDPADHDRLAGTLRRAEPGGTPDVWTLRRPDGGRQTVEVSCRDLRRDPRVRGFIITLCDLSHRQQADQEHIRQALEASPAGQNRQSSTTKYR